MAEQQRVLRSEARALGQRRLDDRSGETLAAAGGGDDHAPDAENTEPRATVEVDFDLSEHEAGRGEQLSVVVADPDVPVLGAEREVDPGGVKRIMLITLELRSVLSVSALGSTPRPSSTSR